jgi:hypothetical protein
MLGRVMALVKGAFAQTEAGHELTPISELSLTEDSNLLALVCFLTDLEIT